MKKRPHIIIFNPDQMRADALGHFGNPASKTPFLDSFVEEDAVSFRSAYCQNTVCVPSRCSFLTGLYPHVHGHRTMSYLLREGEESLFSELMKEGYHVWMNARNDLVAGQIEGLVNHHASTIYYGGQSMPAPGPKAKHIRGKEGDKFYYSHYLGELDLDDSSRNYSRDDEDVDAAIEWLQNRKDDQPICMFLGLNFPHPAYAVEEPYYSAIDREKLPARSKWEETSGKAKMLKMIRDNQQLQALNEDDWNDLRATYLGMCMKVDAQFQRFCSALKKAGIYDDSIIFFFSDHGDYTGDFGISEKSQNTFENCLTNVPLVIKPPKGTGTDSGISYSKAELIDFYATALDYAGIKSSHSHFGKSLRPVLCNREVPNRDYVFCEGGRMDTEIHCDEFHVSGSEGIPVTNSYYPRLKAQTDPIAHGKATMITDCRHKYIRRIYEEDEFYDLEKDPQELSNQIKNSSYKEKILEMQLAMLEWYQGTCDIVPYDYDRRFSFDMVWAKVKGVCPEPYVEEVKQMIVDGANMFSLIQYCNTLQKD